MYIFTKCTTVFFFFVYDAQLFRQCGKQRNATVNKSKREKENMALSGSKYMRSRWGIVSYNLCFTTLPSFSPKMPPSLTQGRLVKHFITVYKARGDVLFATRQIKLLGGKICHRA